MNLNIKFVKSFIVILFTVLFVLILLGHLMLRKNQPTAKEKNLLVEGWLPPYALEAHLNTVDFMNYENVFVLGIASKPDTTYINNLRKKFDKKETKNSLTKLNGNGAVYLSYQALQKMVDKKNYCKIKVYVRGDSSFYRFAHCFCAIGDSVIGQSFTRLKTINLTFTGNFTLASFRFFNIYYGNDLVYNSKDRNLIIDSVVCDNVKLSERSDFIILTDKKLPEGMVNFPFKSNADFTCAYLKALGVQKNMIVIDTVFNRSNKTAAVARRFGIIARQRQMESDTFNTLSFNFHALRSNLTFRRMLPEATIGTICLPDLKRKKESLLVKECNNIRVILDEEISIIGTLLFYRRN